MIIRRGFRFKLKCDGEQRRLLNVYAGHNRFVWNYFLRLNMRRLEHGHKLLWYGEMANYLSFLKRTDEL